MQFIDSLFLPLVSLVVISSLILGIGALLLRWLSQPSERVRCVQLTFIAFASVLLLRLVGAFDVITLEIVPPAWMTSSGPTEQLALEITSPRHSGDASAPMTVVFEETMASGGDDAEGAANWGASSSDASVDAASPLWSMADALLLLRAGCVVVFAGGLLWSLLAFWAGCRQLRALLQSATPVDNSQLVSWTYRNLASIRGVQVFASLHAKSPLTFGLFSPVIVVPEGMLQSSQKETVDFCLNHELAHILNGDIVTHWAVRMLQPLLWWQPLYWHLSRELTAAQDQLADQFVLNESPDTSTYAEMLLQFSQRQSSLALTFGGRPSMIRRRIEMMLQANQVIRPRARWRPVVTMAICLAAASLIVGVVRISTYQDSRRLQAQIVRKAVDPPTAPETTEIVPAKDAGGDASTTDDHLAKLIADLSITVDDETGTAVGAMKELVDMGPDAVPALIDALPTAELNAFRRIPFVLRAIGDERAVPALIESIPRCLEFQFSSDMGLREEGGLGTFLRMHDLDEKNNTPGVEYDLGRPLREVMGALKKMTGESFGELRINYVFGRGADRQKYLAQKQFHLTAVEWQSWWNERKIIKLGAYRPVTLPPLAQDPGRVVFDKNARFVSADGSFSGISLGTVQSEPHYCCYDLDTGAVFEWPDAPPSGPITAALAKVLLRKNQQQLMEWGVDLVCFDITTDNGEPQHELFSIAMSFRHLDEEKEADQVLGEFALRGEFGFPARIEAIQFLPTLNEDHPAPTSVFFQTQEDSIGVITVNTRMKKGEGLGNFYTGMKFDKRFYKVGEKKAARPLPGNPFNDAAPAGL
ncbi:MAG: M56 family metallopeptidase [Planctomycetaceae bacterium]|nr:M56 family metallopeptidase [Planctomycetaceae bacterium]MCB9949799.1 M56 family metallopeptidase [Planctomycetaceae bacterium]